MRQRRDIREVVWWVLRIINVSAMILIALGIGLMLGTYTGIAKLIPNARALGQISPGMGSRVLSAEGKLLATVATENREFVPLERIPKALQDGAVATEDREFYRHVGINPRAILRAAVYDIVSWSPRQGGSTITQQLARSVFLSQSKTLGRKLAEAILALQLERAYTKPEILELYLNQIYFGEGAYGAQVAAKTYFGKDVWALTVAECALVAGLAKRPEYYSPFEDEQRAVDRRNLVLAKMREEGYLTPEKAKKAQEETLKLVKERKPLGLSSHKAPYFTNYVLRKVAADYGPDALYQGNLTIHTTLNLDMQEAAEEAVAWGLEQAHRRRFKVDQLALVALDLRTGAIKAMVGGVDYKKSQYNFTVQGGRQPGSAFKPFVYTAALEAGYTPDSVVRDSPVSYPAEPGRRWSPKNYDGKYHGTVTFRRALAHSYNVSAVKVAEIVGIGSVIGVAERMGIYHQMDPVLPTAIGCCDVTPLEMASAFAAFATRGMRTEPYGIQKIVDARNRVLDQHVVHTWRVLDQGVAEQMTDMLRDVIQRGTGRGIRGQLKFPAAGKTGTSSEYKDAWFVGFTEHLSGAVWAGNEPPKSMGKLAGASVPAPVWARFMVKAEPIIAAARAEEAEERVIEISPAAEGVPEAPTPPSRPEVQAEEGDEGAGEGGEPLPGANIVTKMICPKSGFLAGPYCPDPREVSYDVEAGSQPPGETCNIHTTGPSGDGEPESRPSRPRGETPARAETIRLSVCAITGKLATSYCPIVVERKFDAQAAPTETCSRHGRRGTGP